MRRQTKCLMVTLATLLPGQLAVLAQVQTEATKQFNAKVAAYVELQQRVNAKAPTIARTETDPAKIAIHTKALANGIQQARAGAKPGDIFSPPVAEEFRLIAKGDLGGKEGAPARETVKTGNPAEEPIAEDKLVLAVNTPYPDKAPRSSVPPGLLLKLPQLPKGLEYRFLGRHLILLDSMSNLMVDYLLNVVPKA